MITRVGTPRRRAASAGSRISESIARGDRAVGRWLWLAVDVDRPLRGLEAGGNQPGHRMALLVILAVVSVSCSSGSHRAGGTRPTVSSPEPTSTVSSLAIVLSPSTTKLASVPQNCLGHAVAVSASGPGAAGGHYGFPILFRNTGRGPCTLQGYPGVAGLDSNGGQVMQASRTPQGYLGGLAFTDTSLPKVVLAPGQTGSALLEGSDNPVGTATLCSSYAALLVTPPNTTTSTRLSMSMPGCSGLFIHPLVPGTSGTQPSG